jgi:hypothetical protein
MQARNVALAEILGPQRRQSDNDTSPIIAKTKAPDHASLRSRIRQAYLDVTGGRFNTRALLSELRERLNDIQRPVLDEALKRMQREDQASLYQLDNQVEVTTADRAAAIYFGAEPRHILWIER